MESLAQVGGKGRAEVSQGGSVTLRQGPVSIDVLASFLQKNSIVETEPAGHWRFSCDMAFFVRVVFNHDLHRLKNPDKSLEFESYGVNLVRYL